MSRLLGQLLNGLFVFFVQAMLLVLTVGFVIAVGLNDAWLAVLAAAAALLGAFLFLFVCWQVGWALLESQEPPVAGEPAKK